MIEAGETDEAIEFVVSLLGQMADKQDRLFLQLLRMQKHRFGRRSEKLGDQLMLLFEQMTAAEGDEAAAEDVELPRPDPKPRDERRPLPEDLDIVETEIEPTEEELSCECGKGRRVIGHESSRVLEYVPGHFEWHVTRRPKLACNRCEDGVVVPEGPAKVIDRGLPGPGLLTEVVVRKYADHCPLHRMRKIFRRDGVDLPVSTLSDWVAQTTDVLHPLAERLRAKVAQAHVLQMDATGLRVLDSDTPNGSRRGTIWGQVGDERLAAFYYRPGEAKEDVAEILTGRNGWVQMDAASVFDETFRTAPKAERAGCWAHARRKYVDLPDRRAELMLLHIRKLYLVEREAKKEGLSPEERLALRKERAPPILEKIKALATTIVETEPPKSAVAQAASYTLNQWKELNRFLEDGRLKLDNNDCERALRTVALGRKNYLFAGSDTGGERAADLYTLLGTARLADVDPRAWLRDVLGKLVNGWLASRIDELLPAAWTEAQARA